MFLELSPPNLGYMIQYDYPPVNEHSNQKKTPFLVGDTSSNGRIFPASYVNITGGSYFSDGLS